MACSRTKGRMRKGRNEAVAKVGERDGRIVANERERERERRRKGKH
jgi:hypothetical protein